MINVKTVNNVVDAFPIGILAQKNVLTPEENDLLIANNPIGNAFTTLFTVLTSIIRNN